MAGLVHLSNNILKVALTARSINWHLFRNFGIPAIIFAFIGAFLLSSLSARTTINLEPIFGVILMGFACLEFFNWKLPIHGQWAMRFGGVLSGFFGGFSGHQGALRAMFLSKLKIEPLVFVATTAIISLLVDITRIGVYFSSTAFFSYYPTLLIFFCVPAAWQAIGSMVPCIRLFRRKRSSIVAGDCWCWGLASRKVDVRIRSRIMEAGQ